MRTLVYFVVALSILGCAGNSMNLSNQAVTFSPPTGLNLSCEENCPLTGLVLNGDEFDLVTGFSDSTTNFGVGLVFPSPTPNSELRFSIRVVDPGGIKLGDRIKFDGREASWASVTVIDYEDGEEGVQIPWSTDGNVLGEFSSGELVVNYIDEHQLRLKFEGGSKLAFWGTKPGISDIPLDGNEFIFNLDKLRQLAP
jgi:hypothetical protein